MGKKYLLDTNTVIDYMGNKLPDAIVAATALHHGFVLVTNNASDFDKIKGIKLQNPFTV